MTRECAHCQCSFWCIVFEVYAWLIIAHVNITNKVYMHLSFVLFSALHITINSISSHTALSPLKTDDQLTHEVINFPCANPPIAPRSSWGLDDWNYTSNLGPRKKYALFSRPEIKEHLYSRPEIWEHLFSRPEIWGSLDSRPVKKDAFLDRYLQILINLQVKSYHMLY